MIRIVTLLLAVSMLFPYTPGIGAFKKYSAGQYGIAIQVYRTAVAEAVRTANQKKEVIYLNNIATAFSALGRPDSARAYLAAARKSCLGDANLLFLVKVNEDLLNGDASLSISPQDLSGPRAVLSEYEYGALLVGCGKILLLRNEPEKAMPLFKEARDRFQDNENSVGFADASYFIAKATLETGNLKKALKLTNEALVLFQKGGWYPGIKKCLALKEAVYVKQGDTAAAERVRALKNRLH